MALGAINEQAATLPPVAHLGLFHEDMDGCLLSVADCNAPGRLFEENRMTPRQMHIAYLLRVHTNPGQINALVRQLLVDEGADIYIHINKDVEQEMARHLLTDPRVILVKNTVSVRWADFSQVKATLRLMRWSVASGRAYDYLCLRSGQDLLVRQGYAERLAADEGISYLKYESMDRQTRKTAEKAAEVRLRWPQYMRNLHASHSPVRILRSLSLRLYGVGVRVLPRNPPLPATMALYRGSAWFALHAEVVAYILDFLEANPWYAETFRHTLYADEWFFHTLLLNSPFAGRICNENLLFERWHGGHPRVLTRHDIPAIAASGAYFARKFDEEVDQQVIAHYVEALTRGSVPQGPPEGLKGASGAADPEEAGVGKERGCNN
jgi:hypothetical protein